MKRDIDYINKDMASLESFLARRDVKYRRNFNRFYNNGPRNEDIWSLYGNIISFYTFYDEEVGGSIPYLNVLRSAVDTTTSKLSQAKVRLFLNPVLGTYKTLKTVRNAQIYFDEVYEKQKIHYKAVNCIRDALVFDMGVLWYDWELKLIKRVGPWEFFFDPAEMSNGKLTRCMLIRKQYPLTLLEDLIQPGSSYEQVLRESPQAHALYKIYWDLKNKKQYKFIGQTLVETKDVEFETPPFVWMYYSDPLKGVFSDSMVDQGYRIQRMIDDLCFKIAAAIELTPANTTYIPRGSDIKTAVLASSKTGDVFEYNVSPDGGIPVIAAPPPMDAQWLQLLDLFEQKFYNMVGISQLSAQAKKPSGLNSGVALQTMEDVESERHNVLLNNFIHFQKDVAEKMIDIFPKNEDILPNRMGRAKIKWSDIKKEKEMFNIQASAGSSLSNDPKTKMEQIEKLIAMKVIDPTLAANLLEFPDLESAYSIVTAAYDSNEKIIERAIEDGPDPVTNLFQFYEVTNIQQLYNQACSTLLRLDAADEDPNMLLNLVNLIKQVKGMMEEINAALTSPPPVLNPAMKPPMAPGPTNPLPMA